MTTRDPTSVEQLAGFLEALSDLRPIPNDAGFAFERGEDIPGADAEVLRRLVTARDVLLAVQDYVRVCGDDARAPGLLIWRGGLAQQELERRHQSPYYGPPSRRRAPWEREEDKAEVKEKKQPRKRRRGRIPDGEVGLP